MVKEANISTTNKRVIAERTHHNRERASTNGGWRVTSHKTISLTPHQRHDNVDEVAILKMQRVNMENDIKE